jgi:Tfp pilus assembly PilM family ATPase/Tfp pilus assembly protein PilN
MAAQTAPFLSVIISQKHITLAEANFSDSELRVSVLGDIDPPVGALDGTQIANGEALGRAISEFLTRKQIGARDLAVVLPEGNAVTQLIKLPSMPADDMIGAVRSVAERYAVFAEHSINVDCSTIEEFEEDANKMANVLFAASRSANVEQCLECARVAGLELISVEAAPVAAANAYRDRLTRQGDVVALAVVGEARTDVMIFDRGMLRLCYSANAGLPEQTEQGDWMTPPPADYDPFTPPPQLYSELSHCFRFFQNQFPRSAVHRVVLAADHPKADVIASHLAEQLQLPVELARPGPDLHLPGEVDAEAAATSRSLTLALLRGSALSVLRETELLFPINLLPPSSTLWRPIRPYIKLGIAGVALLLVATIVWAWSLSNKATMKQRDLSRQQAEIARLQPELDALRAAKATELALYSEVERQTARLARERSVHWSQILVDVSDRLPRDMWLIRLASPDSSRMILTGISTNRETIPNAIESLGGSPYLENVRLGSLTKDDVYAPGAVVIRYQINGTLLRGIQPPPMAGLAPAGATQSASGGQEAAR